MAKRGLGKGLNELLSATFGEADVAVASPAEPAPVAQASSSTPKTALAPSEMGIARLSVEALDSGPFQPRSGMNDETLTQLADSIRQQGLLQPILVRPNGERFDILAGERRWRAAKRAGLTEVPVIVRQVTDEEAMAIGLIENIQREDLNPLDTAKGLKRLSEEMSMTHQEVAEAVGKSRTSVTNYLRLLTLNPDVQHALEAGELELGHAKALLGVKGSLQTQMAKMVIKRGLSVRETERVIQRLQEPGSQQRRAGAPDPNIRRLESDLADKLGASVHIRHSTRGKGSVVIQYNDTEELQGILEHIQ
ncbi:MAG: chromosome partitioning protein ParB [Legionellales bacterium]|nr:chromosome partitioning protein ParB [Legionellales bacterium]